MVSIDHGPTRCHRPSRASRETWAIVLAAGEGSRLRCLTTDPSGTGIPKQYCSLRRGPSLLHEALRRAESVAVPDRICTIVARQHDRWWAQTLSDRPNTIVQPKNCGTANGMLLSLLHVLEWDPRARVVVLPSDHYVKDESVLGDALQRAVDALSHQTAEIVLLGIAPDNADTELGYIVPANATNGEPAGVAEFVEKPPLREAHELVARGALWNAFILAADAKALLDLFVAHDALGVQRMRMAVQRDADGDDTRCAVTELYRRLPSVDFSRDVAQGREAALTVLEVPACGWSDLGTLERVAKTLGATAASAGMPVPSSAGSLSLEEQFRSAQQARSPQVLYGAATP